jgi:hypothetical protein
MFYNRAADLGASTVNQVPDLLNYLTLRHYIDKNRHIYFQGGYLSSFPASKK